MALRAHNHQAGGAGSAGHEDVGVPHQLASPWLTPETCAAYLGYDMTAPKKAADAVRHLARRHGLPMFRRGRRIVIARSDVDRWLRAQRVA